MQNFAFPACLILRSTGGVQYCASTKVIEQNLSQHQLLTRVVATINVDAWFERKVHLCELLCFIHAQQPTQNQQPDSTSSERPLDAPAGTTKGTSIREESEDSAHEAASDDHSHLLASASVLANLNAVASETKSAFAVLPPASVPQGIQSWQHFATFTPSYRIHDTAFVMHAFDHKSKMPDLRHFEVTLKGPAGAWLCQCPKAHVSNECFHVLAAAHLEKTSKPIATALETVIACNSPASIWAVLGGRGEERSVVRLVDGKVSTHVWVLGSLRACVVEMSF